MLIYHSLSIIWLFVLNGYRADGNAAELITSWESLGVFSVLLIIEMIVDKVPVLDSVNDVINTVIRPVAGAVLMSATTSALDTPISPEMLQIFSIISGGTSAGGVHAAKAISRPLVTGTTAGTGNWAVSILEDIVSFLISILAILLPFIMVMVGISFLILILWWLWEMQRLDMLKKQGLFH